MDGLAVDRLKITPELPPSENQRRYFVNIGSKHHIASFTSSMCRLLTRQTRRGNKYGEETYTKRRDTTYTETQIEKRHTWRGDTHGEETHMERKRTWRKNTYG